MIKWLHHLRDEMGRGKPQNLIVSSAFFSIVLFFYLINIVSILEPVVYPLIDRVVYVTGFENKHFINGYIDTIIIVICTLLWFQFSLVKSNIKYLFILTVGVIFFTCLFLNLDFVIELFVLLSLPAIFLSLGLNRIRIRNTFSFDWKLTVNYISLFAIFIASVSLCLIIIYILFPNYPLPSLNYLYYFYLILAIFSPLYLLLITFNYPLSAAIHILKTKWKKWSAEEERIIILKDKNAKWRTRIFHLSLIMFLSIVISLIPHAYTINKDNLIIGVDTKDYSSLLDLMSNSTGFYDLIHTSFTVVGGDRPLTLLFYYFLLSIFYQNGFTPLLENLPLLLGPLLVGVTYFLTLGITRNHLTSLLASLITIPSHILIGIYGGLYANWLSLIWEYITLLFLFRIINEPKRIDFFIFSLLLVILILTHSPTWNILLYVLGLFLILNFFFIKNIGSKKTFLYIFFSILPSIVIDIVRLLLINTSGIKQEIGFALQREVGIHGFSTIWHYLIATTHFTLGGLIANPLILLLVLYWLFVTKIKEKYTIFFIIFFTLFALPLLFGDQQIQSRFLFEIPFQIPAAIALTILNVRISNYLTIAICLWLIVMSGYMAGNFVFVIH